LGINPLQIGFPAVQAMVAANFSAMASLAARLGINLSLGLPGLPNLLTIPGLVAAVQASLTATLRAALSLNASAIASLNAIASLDLNVCPSLGVGLAATALATNMSAALGINMALPAPCPVCDARAIMAAVAAA
ncbi:MAG TPA: hypothetical protein VE650_16825, partial [Acetobacteraceae bacterium]|nr:hypothetical protein [Acetobacteraceae bacterium]